MSAARAVADGSVVGWTVGYVIAVVVVLVVAALVVTIIALARSISREAALIDESLQESVANTAPLEQLNTTIESADIIAAGLQRGRSRLGG